MPTPSKFTVERRERILEALRVGASRRTAAAIAGIDHQTLNRWIATGKNRSEGLYHAFHAAVLEAEAHPRMRALGIIQQAMPDRPDLAWKFIERREPGYEPPMQHVPQAAPTVIIRMTLPGGKPIHALNLAEQPALEGEVMDEQDEAAAEAPADAATAD